MASVIWASLKDTVVAACECMEYFQKLARLAAKENLPISWTTPNGLPVVQRYRKEIEKRVKTVLAGRSFRPVYKQSLQDLDRKKQVTGIAPNIIHSLDASAMMLTVCCRERGYHSLRYGPRQLRNSCGRRWAPRVYHQGGVHQDVHRLSVLGNIARDITSCVDLSKVPAEDVPERPLRGTLNLEDVLDSPYFFA
jgi:DNA-directed RNA polymerase, mitochondrial